MLYNLNNKKEITTTKFNYMGSPISFKQDENLMINANHMANPFGKLTADFLRLDQTQDFIEVLDRKLNMGYPIIKKEVGRYGGTWMHEKLALKFAAWLSPEFELWVFDRIEELLTTGKTELPSSMPSHIDALRGWADQLEVSAKQQKEIEQQKLLLQAAEQQNQEAQPKVEAFNELMQCVDAISMQQLAGVLAIKTMGRNSLFSFLRDRGVLNSQNQPYRYYIEAGWFKQKISYYNSPTTGELKVNTTTQVMPKGVNGIRLMLKKAGF